MQASNASAAGVSQPALAVPTENRWFPARLIWQSNLVDWGLIAIATIGGGWLRWSLLNWQSLWVDEMSSFGMALSGLRNIIPTVLAFDGHPPLYIFIVHIAHYNLGLGTVDSVRVPSLVAAILTIPVVYALARLLVGRLAAVLTTGLFVISPLMVWYSREGRMYAITWLFVMLSYLLLIQAVRSKRALWILAYAGAVALSLYADISAVMAIVPQAGVVAWFLLSSRGHTSQRWLQVAAGYAGGWVLFLPWLIVLPRQLGLLHNPFVGYEPTLANGWKLLLNLAGPMASYASIYSIGINSVLALSLTAAYLAAIAASIWYFRRVPLFSSVALSLTVGPAVMALAFLALHSPGVMLPRVMGLAAIGLILSLGGVLALAYESLRSMRLAQAALGVVAIVAFASTALALTNLEAYGSNGEDWKTVARTFDREAARGDALIFYPYGVKIMVDPYLPAGSHWLADSVGLWASPNDVVEANFAKWSAGHARVWVLFVAANAIDMPVHDQWFQSHGYRRISGDPSAGMGFLEYEPIPTNTAGTSP